MRKNNAKISQKKWKSWQKTKILRNIQNFPKLMQNFSVKVAKFHLKRLYFENTTLILKRDLYTSPINGFSQNINMF